MARSDYGRPARGPAASALAAACGLALALGIAGPAAPAAAQDLDEVLREVGEDYARGYLAPLTTGVGAAELSGLCTTADIPFERLTFTVGVRVSAAHIAEDDQHFRRVRQVTLDERYGFDPGDPLYGQTGTLVIDGPTALGDEDVPGELTVYSQGVPVYSETGIEGLWESRWVPLPVPEVSVGGIAGFRATVRWLPTFSVGEVKDISFRGIGLQYGLGRLLTGLPLDAAVGVYLQRLDIGDVLEATATSWFATVSRTAGLLTVYGGLALESSDFDIDYSREIDGQTERIAFTMEGDQDSRGTLGATIGGNGPMLNLEAGFGTMTTVSAGLMMGF